MNPGTPRCYHGWNPLHDECHPISAEASDTTLTRMFSQGLCLRAYIMYTPARRSLILGEDLTSTGGSGKTSCFFTQLLGSMSCHLPPPPPPPNARSRTRTRHCYSQPLKSRRDLSRSAVSKQIRIAPVPLAPENPYICGVVFEPRVLPQKIRKSWECR
ncbi:hypothetical protein PAXRUDRAFT_583989 [Paxillus rubicundulus Ve08.2h10]|uniref:Uncharacterized protein n=1 Tax=Paxillus rubicundulus Ve08.2h10 TaxID=930991 RepID=A0A0D0E4Q3_9AGAM|nr:hypothetical protein PAXRUDRAFT_583989 [Paxillus rubicundulus Ve08.2h10]